VTPSARELIDSAPNLSVGVMSANLLELGAELEQVEAAGATLIHIDVMDGVFCPPTTVGASFASAVPERFTTDVHLMIDEPLDKVDAYATAGAGIVTVHAESTRHPHRVLQSLAGRGCLRGEALNPGTPVGVLEPLLDELDVVLLLGVNPGWGGQQLIPSSFARISEVRQMTLGRDIVVAFDGGVTNANIEAVTAAGADLIVAGSSIFNGNDPAENHRELLDSARRGHKRRE
jgi:ribulose-phosphate 3-epimerase